MREGARSERLAIQRSELLENPEKPRGWHTAFYYLAEHIRFLSCGKINHKIVYSYVGVQGRYVNHSNPIVRKRTAGALSRLIHSKNYVLDMQQRYLQNGRTFTDAARVLCGSIESAGELTDYQLYEYLKSECWIDVLRGLENEKCENRPDLNIQRVEQEAESLWAWVEGNISDYQRAPTTLAAFFHIVAFGHLDDSFARLLAGETGPIGRIERRENHNQALSQACVIRFTDSKLSVVDSNWVVKGDRPFLIGRYTDCDAIERDPSISRLHGCIYRRHQKWYYEDLGSANGSRIYRNGALVFDSDDQKGAGVPTELEHGDVVTLAGRSSYWFGAFSDGFSRI